MEQHEEMVARLARHYETVGLVPTRETMRETATAAVSARAQAVVQARYVMAIQRPRLIDQVRLDMLAECRRPTFAKVARYSKPQGRGKSVTGFSIRFVEAAIRCMKNVATEVTTLYDDDDKRILRCAVIDYEANVDWSQEITIEKTKERRDLREGDVPLGVRKNSYGDTVYLLPANEDDVRQKEGSAVSKTLRTLGLRVLPGDLLDEAEEEIANTLKNQDARDPAEARKELLDGFARLCVKPEALSEYFGGMPLDTMGPAERQELRGIFVLMREGERWVDIFASSPHRGSAIAEAAKGDERLSAVRAKVTGKVEDMRAAAKKKPEAKSSQPLEGTEEPPRERQPGEGEAS